MGHMGRIDKRDGPENGHMRAAMPTVAGWIDDLRLAFGQRDVTAWVREGIADGSFYAKENGHEIGIRESEPLNAVSVAQMVLEPTPAPKATRR